MPEMSDTDARELLRLLGRYFDSYEDESPAMTVSALVEDLAMADPDAPLTERLSAARSCPPMPGSAHLAGVTEEEWLARHSASRTGAA